MNAQLKIISLLIGTALLGACGANKASTGSGSSDLSSRSVPEETGPTVSEGTLADCNGFTNTGMNMAGAVSTFYNPSTNAYIPQYIRFRFTQAPLEVATSSRYIQFFRWGIDSNNNRIYNSTPAPIYFQLISNGQYINSTPETTISKNTIQRLITNNNLAAQGITVDTFLSKVFLVLDGMSLEYDAMSVAVYDSSSGSSTIGYSDVLLPSFSANPNTYAKLHPNTNLQILHPNWDIRTSGYTDSQYFYRTETFCRAFLQ